MSTRADVFDDQPAGRDAVVLGLDQPALPAMTARCTTTLLQFLTQQG